MDSGHMFICVYSIHADRQVAFSKHFVTMLQIFLYSCLLIKASDEKKIILFSPDLVTSNYGISEILLNV